MAMVHCLHGCSSTGCSAHQATYRLSMSLIRSLNGIGQGWDGWVEVVIAIPNRRK
jgi:hypothetical protein